jgi:serine/threonine-protein kinase
MANRAGPTGLIFASFSLTCAGTIALIVDEAGKVILLTVVVSLITSAGTFFVLQRVSSGKSLLDSAVVVPTLTGLRTDQARKLLEPEGLMLVVSEQREDPKVERGLIISQIPMEGSRVKNGSEVSVIISKGMTSAAVPNVVKMSLANAMQALTSAGLQVGTTTRQASDEIEKDRVVATSPAIGQQAPNGSKVNLVVSDGPSPVKVPSVVYKGLTRARKLVEEAGLKVGRVTYTYDEDRAEGVVLRQTPSADAMAAKGSEVDLLVNETE